MRKITVSIVASLICMMALLAACGDSGSSPVAPVSDDIKTVSSSSIEFRTNPSSSSFSADTIDHHNRFAVYEICDDFSIDALNDAVKQGRDKEAVNEFLGICDLSAHDAIIETVCFTWNCVEERVIDQLPFEVSKSAIKQIWNTTQYVARVLKGSDKKNYMLVIRP